MVDKEQYVPFDRTPEEQERLERLIDGLSAINLWSDLIHLFGTRRTLELLGWAARWQLAGIEDISAIRKRYEDVGLSRTGAYRAAADCKRAGDYLLAKYGPDVLPDANVTPLLKILALGVPYAA